MAGIVLDASGLFFQHWFYASGVEQIGSALGRDST
jgi:hypothetical protein